MGKEETLCVAHTPETSLLPLLLACRMVGLLDQVVLALGG